MAITNKRGSHRRSLTQFSFNKALDKNISSVGLKMQINSVLDGSDKTILADRKKHEKHKRNLNSLEAAMNKEKSITKFNNEDKADFIKSYKKVEEYKHLVNSKSSRNLNPFENVYHDTLVKYFNKGYNVHDLRGKMDVFEASPLLVEKNEMVNYFKSLDMRNLKKNDDLEYLLKLETLAAVGLSDEERRILAERERILRNFSKKSRSRNLYRSVAELQKQTTKLREDIHRTKKTIEHKYEDTEVVDNNISTLVEPSHLISPKIRYKYKVKNKSQSMLSCSGMKSYSDLSTKPPSLCKGVNESKTNLNSSQISTFRVSSIKENLGDRRKSKKVTLEHINHIDDSIENYSESKFFSRTSKTKTSQQPQESPIKGANGTFLRRNKSTMNINSNATYTKLPSHLKSPTRQRQDREEFDQLDDNKKLTHYLERQKFAENIVSDLTNNPSDQKTLQLVKWKVERYNNEYLGHESKTIDNLFCPKLQPVVLWKQISDLRETVKNFNIPEMLKTKLNGFNEDEEKRVKNLVHLDLTIGKLNVDMAKKINFG
jgi:hypothetical protein